MCKWSYDTIGTSLTQFCHRCNDILSNLFLIVGHSMTSWHYHVLQRYYFCMYEMIFTARKSNITVSQNPLNHLKDVNIYFIFRVIQITGILQILLLINTPIVYN